MTRSDKHEYEARARVVLALLASEITVAEAASKCGVTEQEVLLWKELYLAGARAQLAAQSPRRPWSKRTQRLVAAGAALGLVGIAGVAASQSTWPISLITFTADTPAVASEVNGNFNAVKTGIEQVKTWVESKTGPVDQGALMNDFPGGTYDLWLQGSNGSTASGDARNLALLGDSVNDKLLLNVDGEYAGGIDVQSGMNVLGVLNAKITNVAGLEIASPTATGLQPLSITTLPGNPNRSLLLDDDEILVSGSQPLYIQGNGTTTGMGGPTQLGGDVGVLGSLTVKGTIESANRLVVTSRYDADFPGANLCTSSVAIDMTAFRNLCSDVDGCSITMMMKDYETSERQDASIGPLHFDYDYSSSANNGIFRAADIPALPGNELSRTIGTDGNNVLEHAVRAWNCFLTDSSYPLNSSTADPDGPGAAMFLVNINITTAWKPDCVLVVDD